LQASPHGAPSDAPRKQQVGTEESPVYYIPPAASIATAQQLSQDNLRFNKFDMNDPTTEMVVGRGAYPMEGDLAKLLRRQSDAVSVVSTGDYGLRGRNFADYINVRPSHPGDPEFWDELEDIVDFQLHRRSNSSVSLVMEVPELWAGWDIDTVAQAVRNEYPGYHQSRLLESFWRQGVEIDPEIIPGSGSNDFLGKVIMAAAINTWAIQTISAVNFHAKWSQGRCRPEEVAYRIASGELTVEDGLPGSLVDKILSMGLTSPEDFTAYPEGAPKHPSWPAMHSAASNASFWMTILFSLTEEQKCQALRTDYAVSFGRSVAGVHYSTDNLDGLNLGQAVLADELAGYLSLMYGADEQAIQRKIDENRFNWYLFDPFSCQVFDF